MSAFKDCVESDILETFLNLDEFGETHNFDGVDLPCVINKDLTQKRARRDERNFDGLHGDFITVYVKQSDCRRVPKQGENIKLDDKRYKVEICREEMGVMVVTLAAYRMGGAG